LFRKACERVTTTPIALEVMRLNRRFVQRSASAKALHFAPSARALRSFETALDARLGDGPQKSLV